MKDPKKDEKYGLPIYIFFNVVKDQSCRNHLQLNHLVTLMTATSMHLIQHKASKKFSCTFDN